MKNQLSRRQRALLNRRTELVTAAVSAANVANGGWHVYLDYAPREYEVWHVQHEHICTIRFRRWRRVRVVSVSEKWNDDADRITWALQGMGCFAVVSSRKARL